MSRKKEKKKKASVINYLALFFPTLNWSKYIHLALNLIVTYEK